MTGTGRTGRLSWALCVLLLLLQGCAAKLPKTMPLAGERQMEAEALLAVFSGEQRPRALDADLKLGWDFLTGKGTAEAMIQIQEPALLRFTITDPLGRALVIAVSDGTAFTLVDNRQARGYQGTVDSNFWHSYVPPSLAPEDLLPLLGGFLPPEIPAGADMASAEKGAGFWYIWRDQRSLTHYLLLEPGTARMTRRVLVDSQGKILLDIRYTAYRPVADAPVFWPHRVEIEGEMVTGRLTVQVIRIQSLSPAPVSRFQLSLPPHYILEQVP